MTEAEKAFAEAERLIEQALSSNADQLDLADLDFLEQLPVGIKKLTNLKALRLGWDDRWCKVADLDVLNDLNSLHTLDLVNLPITDFAFLKGLSRLKLLDVSGTQIDDLTDLSNLTALKHLLLIRTPITDLTPLQNLSALWNIHLDDTQVTDVSPLQNLTALKNLVISNTHVDDIWPLQKLPNLRLLDLHGTKVMDLRPLLGFKVIANANQERGFVSFTKTPATAASPELTRLSEIEDPDERLDQTLAYLRTLPPYPEPLSWETRKDPPTADPEPITATQLIEAQDAAGWRFSPELGAMRLYIEDTALEERQNQLAKMSADRVAHLLDKLGTRTNAGGLRQEVAEEAQRFADILADDTRSLSLRSLELWGSLVALGGHLDANDLASKDGRDPLDLLAQEARTSLQTFLAVAGNLVRSFPEARALDDGSLDFSRKSVTPEMIVALLQTALNTQFVEPDSGALIQHVAGVADRPGPQGDKAFSTTAIGARNLVLAAAIAAPVYVAGEISSGILNDIGTDISNEYELGEKAIAFIETARTGIETLLANSPPDEAARIRAILEDLENRQTGPR